MANSLHELGEKNSAFFPPVQVRARLRLRARATINSKFNHHRGKTHGNMGKAELKKIPDKLTDAEKKKVKNDNKVSLAFLTRLTPRFLSVPSTLCLVPHVAGARSGMGVDRCKKCAGMSLRMHR